MNAFNKLVCVSILVVCFFLVACHKDVQSEQEIYVNDFESSNLDGIRGGMVNTYNGTRVIGFYNNDGFELTARSLDKHELIKVSFDLYLHDTWAGNNTGTIDVVDGPDIWELRVDGETFISTTFSNSGCFPTYCQQQSYPNNFPFHNDAGKGAVKSNLPGRCARANVAGGTTMYRIEKYINHSRSDLVLEFRDLLKQSNAVDNLCDESWSLDNLSVHIIKLD